MITYSSSLLLLASFSSCPSYSSKFYNFPVHRPHFLFIEYASPLSHRGGTTGLSRSLWVQEGAHKEEDWVKDQRKHNEKTKKNQDSTLNRYVFWHLAHIERDHLEHGLSTPSEEGVRSEYLSLDTKLLNLIIVKDFLRCYIYTS